MPVETIECQLVQAQLGRYLSGEAFSNEALSQLEDHIANCEICRQEVSVRRATLQSLLGPTFENASRPDALIGALNESHAPSKMTVPTEAVVEQVVPDRTSHSPKTFNKPMMYGTALAVVLIAMTYIGRNPTSIFGERVSDVPASAPAAVPAIETIQPVSQPIEETAVEPLSIDEWANAGLADWLPYDSEDMGGLAPWEWLGIAEILTPDEAQRETSAEGSAPATIESSVSPGQTAPTLTPPATSTPTTDTAKPKPKPRAKPRAKATAPKQPTNTIRVYEPGQ
jgi:hypothetical protein